MRITVKQFQELHYISEMQESEIDKSIKLVGCLTGKTPDEVEKMKVKDFNKVCAKIKKQFGILTQKWLNTKPRRYVMAKGRLYRLNYDIKKITAGKYVDSMAFSKDMVGKIHIIMATIAEPINWRGKVYERNHDDIASDMEQLNFEVAYHAGVFFYLLFQMSMVVTRPYLVRQITKQGITKEEAETLLQASSSISDGLPMPKWSQNTREYLSNLYGT